MRDRETAADNARPQPLQLRVFRVEPATTEHVRLLSYAYGGLFTHWGKRSLYCDPRGCRVSGCPRGERYWKGYGLVERWVEQALIWVPVVLEITENLELDFRGVWARGQVWRLTRMGQEGRKKTPVTGRMVETLDPDSVRPEVGIGSVLKAMYHVDQISLEAKNPMPPRTYVEPVKGAPPPGMGERAPVETRATPEQLAKMRELLRGRGSVPAKLGDQ